MTVIILNWLSDHQITRMPANGGERHAKGDEIS
jgi:hypothetical protein